MTSTIPRHADRSADSLRTMRDMVDRVERNLRDGWLSDDPIAREHAEALLGDARLICDELLRACRNPTPLQPHDEVLIRTDKARDL
jgi:uncharacterized protein (DUF2336 family)